ncbi:hypothetical protein [Streptomyces sp. NPDC001401]|uniref:hypothetical protein n=1 Tax=Streptomyces sp. NPDC001401 TaxID=3364570 RepID=UPI0036768208
MIGLRVGARTARRPGRVGPLLALVVLITLHLAGSVHGASFEGPHLSLTVTERAQHDAGEDLGEPLPGCPTHHHHADGHIDHAADRPRTTSVDGIGPASGPHGLAPIPAVAPSFVRTEGSRDPPRTHRSPYGRFALVLRCVWRQ